MPTGVTSSLAHARVKRRSPGNGPAKAKLCLPPWRLLPLYRTIDRGVSGDPQFDFDSKDQVERWLQEAVRAIADAACRCRFESDTVDGTWILGPGDKNIEEWPLPRGLSRHQMRPLTNVNTSSVHLNWQPHPRHPETQFIACPTTPGRANAIELVKSTVFSNAQQRVVISRVSLRNRAQPFADPEARPLMSEARIGKMALRPSLSEVVGYGTMVEVRYMR